MHWQRVKVGVSEGEYKQSSNITQRRFLSEVSFKFYLGFNVLKQTGFEKFGTFVTVMLIALYFTYIR